jgi:predicted metal-binding membrane protein
VALTRAALAILAALLALAALGWAYVSAQSGAMMMSAGPDGTSFAIFLATWVVMMAAMMFPAFAPAVLVYAQYTRQRTGTWPLLSALFVAGYLVIWSAVGVGAYALVAVLVPLILDIPMVRAAPQVFLGAVIGAAGLYQLTPLKDSLLKHCRSPFHWLLRGFRPGARGALLMGIDEGVVCLGCCAGLMLVLLAVGVASVGWMAAVAAIIFGEKVLAPTAAVAKGVAVLLVGFGIAVATIPAVAEFVMGGPGM